MTRYDMTHDHPHTCATYCTHLKCAVADCQLYTQTLRDMGFDHDTAAAV